MGGKSEGIVACSGERRRIWMEKSRITSNC
jgi:hypothetical protein